MMETTTQTTVDGLPEKNKLRTADDGRRSDLTIFHIEHELADLVVLRDEMVANGEDCTAIDTEISAYLHKEIAKVDGIRNYLRHCDVMAAAAKEESQRQAAKAKMWEARRERLKEICQAVMAETGRKRLEGRVGVLRIQANGGKRPVLLNAPAMIPEEFCQYDGRISGHAWAALRALLNHVTHGFDWFGRQDVQMERKPMLPAIGAKLEAGEPVPGASLGPKGEHLRVE